MSVTFTTTDATGRLAGGRTPAEESPCLCAQFAPSWGLTVEDRADLAKHADPACPHCNGTGVEMAGEFPRIFLNLNDGNAAALLRLLGLEDRAWGEVSIPEARRAIMRARATWDRRAPALERPSYVEHGAPRTREDGAVELRPVRVIAGGLDLEGLRERFESFARVVEDGAAAGAVTLTWS